MSENFKAVAFVVFELLKKKSRVRAIFILVSDLCRTDLYRKSKMLLLVFKIKAVKVDFLLVEGDCRNENLILFPLDFFADFHQPSYSHHRILIELHLKHCFLPPSVGFESCACAAVRSLVDYGVQDWA